MIFNQQSTPRVRDKQYVDQFFKNMTETMKAWLKLINLLRKMEEDTFFYCEDGRAHKLRTHLTAN